MRKNLKSSEENSTEESQVEIEFLKFYVDAQPLMPENRDQKTHPTDSKEFNKNVNYISNWNNRKKDLFTKKLEFTGSKAFVVRRARGAQSPTRI